MNTSSARARSSPTRSCATARACTSSRRRANPSESRASGSTGCRRCHCPARRSRRSPTSAPPTPSRCSWAAPARSTSWRSDDDAALVSSICVRLDGIPLALELAAARLSSMSLSQLHERLDQRFRLLTGGSRNVMARQQTLQALVDWSYGLLSPAESERAAPSVGLRRRLHPRGGRSRSARATLVDEFDVANVLHSLVAKSLVVADKGVGSVRFRLLETIRQYSAQKLLDTEGDEVALEVRDRHADFYVALAVAGGAGFYSPHHSEWARTLDVEGENLRATLTHCAASPVEDRGRPAGLRGDRVVPRVAGSSCDLLPYPRQGHEARRATRRRSPVAAALIIQGQLEIAFSMLDDEKVARAALMVERGLAIARAHWAMTRWSLARWASSRTTPRAPRHGPRRADLAPRVHRRRARSSGRRRGDRHRALLGHRRTHRRRPLHA